MEFYWENLLLIPFVPFLIALGIGFKIGDFLSYVFRRIYERIYG